MNGRIKEIRKELKLNQQQFADKLGVTQTLISKIESGRSRPTLTMLNKIEELFGVGISFVVTGVGEKYIENSDAFDKASDNENHYKSKNKVAKTTISDDKCVEMLEKFTTLIESKDAQIDKMLAVIQKLTDALNQKI